MRSFFLILLIPFISFFAEAQDVILKMNGDEIRAKVLEVSSVEIKFKKSENPDGPTYILPISEINKITYENGSVDSFNNISSGDENDYYYAERETTSYSKDLRIRGVDDANTFYKNYKTAGTVTLVASLIYPPFGLIPAIGTSATMPQEYNLNYPSEELYNNYEYRNAYQKQAKSIKQRKVWTNFGIAVGIWVVAAAFSTSLQ